VLGHGDALSSPVPRILRMFDSKRVIEIGAGFQHVLVLTEHDGVYAFGDGSHGKLGLGEMIALAMACAQPFLTARC
jgi:alpha-tubulin suppressor-like RCC1 family protein